MTAKYFRASILFQLSCLIVEILLFAYFLPTGVHRFGAHRMDTTTFVFLVAFIAVIAVFIAFMALFYTIEIGDSELTVRAVFVLTRVDIGSVRYLQQSAEILPMYVLGVNKGLAGQTVRYVMGVRHEIEFMAALRSRNGAIRFSKRNEKRIKAYLSKMGK